MRAAICDGSAEVFAARAGLPALLLLFCTGEHALAAGRSQDLDGWVSRDLVPWLGEALSAHPRFRDEPLRFVVMKGSNPQPVASALAIGLRDRVQDALMDTPGIRIAWRPDRPGLHRLPGRPGVDCAADEVHYYVGLEITEIPGGRFELTVRALDLEDRSWVSGFGRTWQGSLTAAEHRAWRGVQTDRSFLGEREVPFEGSQTDLLAAQLAHELGCALLRQLEGEFVAETFDAAAGSTSIVELVSNNLAEYRALRLTTPGNDANAVIEAQAHRIDGDLFQYWITIRPSAPDSGLPALSASAYVIFPEDYRPVETLADVPTAIRSQAATVLDSLQLVALDRSAACVGRHDCYALQALARTDAVVFFLNHQVHRGLVRLADRDCARRPAARIARANEPLRFPLPVEYLGAGSWLATADWELDPGTDTFQVIAAGDSKAARALAKHIGRLPSRCTSTVRSGLEGQPLERWLRELEAIASEWAPHVEWRIIRVKNVY